MFIVVESDFSTNTFGKNNNYIDLMDYQEPQSEQYGNPEQVGNKSMTGKQVVNKTKAKAEEVKMKATDFFESLIWWNLSIIYYEL